MKSDIIFIGPFVLLPLLIIIVLKFLKKEPGFLTYFLNYILLVIYFFVRHKVAPKPSSDVIVYDTIFSLGIFAIVVFFLAPVSLLLQYGFNDIFNLVKLIIKKKAQ